MWISTTAGTDDHGTAVNIGDGIVHDGTEWLTVGPIRGPKGNDGEGVPTGGTTGQALVKKSNTNFDSEWTDSASGISNQYNQNNITFQNTAGDYFGTLANPRSNTLTFDPTDAVGGAISTVWYQNATLDIPALGIIKGTFDPVGVNKLYFERDHQGEIIGNIVNTLSYIFIKSDIVQAKIGKVITNMVECTANEHSSITPDSNTFYLING